MTSASRQRVHLENIRRQLAVLVAMIEDCCSTALPTELAKLDETRSLARDLLTKVCLVEQVASGHDEDDAVLRLDELIRAGQDRIDALDEALQQTPRPTRPAMETDDESSGSVIGDTVRDSILNFSHLSTAEQNEHHGGTDA